MTDIFPHECDSGRIKILDHGDGLVTLELFEAPPFRVFKTWMKFCPGCGLSLEEYV